MYRIVIFYNLIQLIMCTLIIPSQVCPQKAAFCEKLYLRAKLAWAYLHNSRSWSESAKRSRPAWIIYLDPVTAGKINYESWHNFVLVYLVNWTVLLCAQGGACLVASSYRTSDFENSFRPPERWNVFTKCIHTYHLFLYYIINYLRKTSHFELGMMAHACDCSTWNTNVGGSGLQLCLRLPSKAF